MYCVDWSGRGWWPEWPKNVRGHRWRIFFLKSKVMEKPRRNFAGRGVCPHLGHLSFQPRSPCCRSPLSCSLSYNYSVETPTGISDRGLTLPPWLLVRQRVPQFTNIYWTIPQQTPRLYPSYFIQHRTTLWEQKEGRLPALSAVQSQSQGQPGKCWSSRAGREKTAGFVRQSLLLLQGLRWRFLSFLHTLQCQKVVGSRRMCSLRLQPLARPLKKVLPVFLYSVAQTPDCISSLPSFASCVLCANLSMLLHINLNSRRTWNYQSLFGHDTDTIVHVSLLRDGHHWTRAGLAWKEGTESWNGRLCRSHSTSWVEKRARTGLKTFLYSSPSLKSFYLSYDSPSQCTTRHTHSAYKHVEDCLIWSCSSTST